MRLNRGRMPPSDGQGGWHFPVEPGVVVHGATEDALTKAIFEYRLRNNIPIGNIEQDIDLYYCTKWPTACHETAADTQNVPQEALMNRVALWAAATFRKMPRGGFALESREVAIARAKACHGCPKNTSWRGRCGSCTAATSKLLLDMSGMRKTEVDGNLLACSIGGWDNRSGAWLPVEVMRVTDGQKAMMPERCWRKKV